MEMVRELRRQLAYDDWANREVLSALESSDGSPPARALELMGHIIGAQRLWLGRLQGEQTPAVAWPELALDQCEMQLEELRTVWEDYWADLTTAKLAQQVAYTNTKGEEWENTVGDILIHVVIHSAYHRAQIASELRAAGHEPAYTDYINCIRQRFVE